MAELRNLARLCAMLAVAVFALLGGTQFAWAHAGHGHEVAAPPVPSAQAAPTPVAPTSAVVARKRQALARAAGEIAATPAVPAKQSSQNECCCNGALCHGGALPANPPEGFECVLSEEVALPAPLVVPLSLAFSIERPPR